MAENTIDNLSIQVVASAERAISTFNRLASGASGLRGAARGAAGGMQDMAQGARDAGTATQEAGTQAGSATISVGRFWNALRSLGSQISGGFVQAVHRGTAAVGTFIKSIARIAFYRAIRSIIKDLGQSFKDLYGYSRLFGTDFAKSMDRITTASVYLRNSFAAMVAPLVNLFAPALDMLADKIVDILNFVNQLFAAINGQETYTVAKKVATTWESTFDSAANHANRRIKEVRNTLLGFDEINRLNGETPTTSGSTGSSPYTPGYSTMFEEKPLEGFFEKISNITSGWPDWLKWLLGIGTVAIGAWGISKLPGLIGKIFDAFKNLFSITLPDWLRWLFGPKGDNDIGLDIPDHIDLPDADITTNLKKGDWDILQEIPSEKYLLLKVGVKMDGWIGNNVPELPNGKPIVIDVNDDDETWDFTTQLAAIGSTASSANKQIEALVDNWDDLAWEVANWPSGSIIDRTLSVAVKKGDWNNEAWKAANMIDGVAYRTVNAIAKKGTGDEWNATAWLAANMTNYVANRTVKALAKKGVGDEWDSTAWLAANMTNNVAIRTVKSVVKQDDNWDKTAWLSANMTSYTATRTVKAVAKKGDGDEWNATAWLAANMTNNTALRTIKSLVKKGEGDEWNATAWLAANMTNNTAIRTVKALAKKGTGDEWDATAWLAANMTNNIAIRTVKALAKQGEGDDWNATAWLAATMTNNVVTRKIKSIVKKGTGKEWNATAWLAANMTNNVAIRTVKALAKKGEGKEWNATAWLAATMTNNVVTRTVKAITKKGKGKEWDATAWLAACMTDNVTTRTIKVVLEKDGWDTVEKYIDDSFGGATGGGGKTSGGGAGRNISVGVELSPTWSEGLGGITGALGLSNETVDITANAKKGWKDSYKSEVGANDTTSTITANLSKAWGKQKPLEYLGLSDLTAVIKTKLQKEKNNAVSYKINAGGGTGKGVVAYELKRRGGVFSNGRWSNIPQYANGTLNAGTIFAAGEAGPEVVGHVGGRTEVLNKSQLASAMYSAVQAAMAPAAANFAAAAQSMSVADADVDMETLAEMVRQGVEQAMGRQNELDRQRNEYLRQISEKDLSISTRAINDANRYMNRRAGTTIVPVGT